MQYANIYGIAVKNYNQQKGHENVTMKIIQMTKIDNPPKH